MHGGKVKNTLHLKVIGVVGMLGAGMLLAGCKSAPPLDKAQALAMIQAKYDQAAPAGVNIVVNDQGMGEGVIAKYWVETKRYPNGYWGDFTLTPDGKKLVKLQSGGDVIQWHPTTVKDPNYNVILVTLVTHHLKARDITDPQDEVLPGADTAKGADYSEAVDMEGIPGPLQDIAHNPGNQLSIKRHADFALENGVWKLRSTE